MVQLPMDGIAADLAATHRILDALDRSVVLVGHRYGGFVIRAYPPADPFAPVRGKDKAIRITSDEMGETVAIASGTEPLATAAAVPKALEHVLRADRT